MPFIFLRQRGAYALACLAILSFSINVFAGEPKGKKQDAAGASTFTTHSELVLVPAIVTDRSGAHMRGIGKPDFAVFDNGVEQTISTFEEVTTTSAPVHREPNANGIYTNALAVGPEARRLNILVFDLVNTSFTDQEFARAEILKFLEKSASSDQLTALLSFTRSGEVKVVHDFTSDNRVLLEALRKMKGKIHAMAGENQEAEAEANAGLMPVTAFGSSPEDFLVNDMMRMMDAKAAQVARGAAIQSTLDAFHNIALAYSGVPGRKALIWVTGSFPFRLDTVTPSMVSDPSLNSAALCLCDRIEPERMGFAERWKVIMDQFNDANIAVYPVDARGLTVVGFTASSTNPMSAARRIDVSRFNSQLRAQFDAERNTLETMINFAAMTGGRAFYNTNDIAGSAERAAEDSAHYYVLGYYRKPKPGEKPSWHRLQVKVRREHTHVRARSGYLVVEPNSEEQAFRADLANAASSPFDFTGIPLSFRFNGEGANDASGKKQLPFAVKLNAGVLRTNPDNNNFMSLEFVVVARDAAMKMVDQRNRHLEGHLTAESLRKLSVEGLTYQSQLVLPPGDYSVRVVVRDNVSGRVGGLQAPLKVQ
ncbi:MAG: VWA domain-containing protein [Terriglobales bacterium]